jgi:hypothetical protein
VANAPDVSANRLGFANRRSDLYELGRAASRQRAWSQLGTASPLCNAQLAARNY